MARIGFRSLRPSSLSATPKATALTPRSPTQARGVHNPSKPAVSSQGTARSLFAKSEPKAPEGYGLTRRNEGLLSNQRRSNAPQLMASNNPTDVKPGGQLFSAPGGVVVNSTHGLAGTGEISSLGRSDLSAPTSYKSDLSDRVGKPVSSYTGAPGTKAEQKTESRLESRRIQDMMKSNTGGPSSNNVVANEKKYGYSYANENSNGRFTREGAAEASYTSAAARVEDSHQGRYGRTEWKASAEGPGAKVGGEYELRANKNSGEQALAAHGKLEGKAQLYNVNGTVDHKFNKNFGVGAHGFSDATASTSHEASLVADRKQHTYMAKVSSSAIAGVQAGGGVSGKVGPFQGDVTAGKMVGVGYAFNAGAGVNRGVYSGVVDLGGALGAGGRLRVGASFDGVEAKDSLRNAHNKMTNPNYSQDVRNYTKGATPEERAQFQKQTMAENELFNAAYKQQLADQRAAQVKNATAVEIPSGSLSPAMFDHIFAGG
ncbi:hypothetical protein [Hyalangium versicolor]|uniref:hypothetical protein n=1 Tax=Hyalangium versicolor TaxID=2861190 RepID=UPI001CCAF55F|nr:hypothetical protein [Hyalangium versicolor]